MVKERGKPTAKAVAENMWPYTDFDEKKHEIDMMYYFNSLIEIFASLMQCNEKRVSEIIDRQYEILHSKKREQSTIDVYFNKRSRND
jgi:hypothetical protein